VGVTTAIAQFMRELERAWDAHREALGSRHLAAQLGIVPPAHGTATGRAASGLAR